MGKRKKKKKVDTSRKAKPVFLETHWDKIILCVLILLPIIYFGSFLSPDKMIAGSDYLIGGYPLKKWIAAQEEFPLWYSHIFGGVPIFGSPVGGPLAPTEYLREILPIHVVLPVSFILFFILAGIGTYLYLKAIGLSKYSAAVGAVIYQFIGNLATTPMAGHSGRAASVALFPLALFCLHKGLQTKKLLYFILLALVTAFTFYEGHFQITYYGLLVMLAYVIYYLVSHRTDVNRRDVIRIIGYGVVSIILIFALMAVVWLPVLGGLGVAARGVERGFEYVASWSMPLYELIDLAIPTYSGVLKGYWGLNSFKLHMEYFGMVALVFGIFSFILFWKKRYVRFFTVVALITMLIALGGYTPVLRILYSVVPGFKLMRAPALIFYLTSFSFVVMGAIAFDNFFVRERPEKERRILQKRFYIAGGLLLGIMVIVGLICTIGRESVLRSMQDAFRTRLLAEWGSQIVTSKLAALRDNYSNFISGVWRNMLILAIILAMVFIWLKRKFRVWVLAVFAIGLTLVDQMPFMVKFLPSGPAPKVHYAADNAVQFIKKDPRVFRVFPMPYYEGSQGNYLLFHGIQSIGGYIANPISRYQEFIGAGTSVMYRPFNLVSMGGEPVASFEPYHRFVDMLNCTYVIGPTLPDDLSRVPAQYHGVVKNLRDYYSRFAVVHRTEQTTVLLNEHALPRAYLVGDYRILRESEILDHMRSPRFDPRQTVVLETDPGLTPPDTTQPLIEAKILKYEANRIECAVNAPYNGILVLADNWHPDWKVFVDDREQECLQANYIFRAVAVPQGEHIVAFSYYSEPFNIGTIITTIALCASVIMVVLIVLPRRKRLEKH